MSAQSPRPTDHEVSPGCTLDRRTFFKTSLATGAALATAGASSGTAAASTTQSAGMLFAPTSPTLTGLMFAKEVADSQTNDDPSADEIALHQLAMTARSWWDDVYKTTLDNRLQDAEMAAHVEARSAIADAWEDGKNTSEAQNDVYTAIEDFYSNIYSNVLETASSVLTQVSSISKVARSSSEINDRFVASTIPNDKFRLDSQYTPELSVDESNTYIGTEVSEVDCELPNGEQYTIEAPTFHQTTLWDNTGNNADGQAVIEYTFDDSLLNKYDPDSGEFVDYSINVSGANWEDYWSEELVNIRGAVGVIGTGDDLEGATVVTLSEVAEKLNEIETANDDAKLNYDLTLIEDLYAELDAGNIDPADVRGVEGVAEHLSGETDATSDRYQMALMNTLGLDRNDLSESSSMVIEYSGFTEREIVRAGDGTVEEVQLSGEVDGAEYEGQLFGDLVDGTTLTKDGKYAVGGYTDDSVEFDGQIERAMFFDAASGEQVDLLEGVVTVKSMSDRDGNDVEEVEWDRPEYDAVDTEAFRQYIQTVSEEHANAVAEEEENGDGITIPNPFDGDGGGGGLLGMGIIAVALLAVVGFVTDLIPGLGD